jgi:hypothetical protein
MNTPPIQASHSLCPITFFSRTSILSLEKHPICQTESFTNVCYPAVGHYMGVGHPFYSTKIAISPQLILLIDPELKRGHLYTVPKASVEGTLILCYQKQAKSPAKMQIDYRLRYAQLITSFPWTPARRAV